MLPPGPGSTRRAEPRPPDHQRRGDFDSEGHHGIQRQHGTRRPRHRRRLGDHRRRGALPRPQRQRPDGPLRGPAPRRRGTGRRPARAALARGEGRPDVPHRHRGGRRRHRHRGARARSASRRPASSCWTSTSPTSTCTSSRTPGWRPCWHNALQALAEGTPHGIPVTISTDPRHAFIENAGVSFTAKAFSQWPEPLGLAALRDAELVREFADIARQEYVAVGIRAALHPTLDLATEPRWARQAGTFGQDAGARDRARHRLPRGLPAEGARARQRGLHRRSTSPAAAPRRTARTPTSPTGASRSTPAVGSRSTWSRSRPSSRPAPRRSCPTTGCRSGSRSTAWPIEEVGFGYNAQVVTGMLREQLGYDGVVLTDWELVNDNHVGDQVLPARAWGVEHLDPHERMERIIAAGADQFGGEECVDVLLDLVAQGRVTGVPDRRVGPAPAGREVPPRAVRRPVRRRGRGVAHRGSRRLPGRRLRGTGPLGHRAHQRQHGCRPGPSRSRAGCASTPRT